MACSNKGLNEIILFMPMRIKNALYKILESKIRIREIRIRINKPIVLVTENGCAFIKNTGKVTYLLSGDVVKISRDEFDEIVKRISNYSLYSYQDEINKGFITVSGGHRIGICGTAVVDDFGTKIISVKSINCLNIRVANEVYDCSIEIVQKSFSKKLSNVVLAGPPNCGKTTVLRDLARQISNGNAGTYYKCVVIDERNEISGSNGSSYLCDVGENTDVLVNYPKNDAIKTAVRTMSPDIIFCDETASVEEARQIIDGILCGVSFVISVHCNSEKDFYSRNIIKILADSGLFDCAYFLGKGAETGKIVKVLNFGDENENGRANNAFHLDSCNRQLDG